MGVKRLIRHAVTHFQSYVGEKTSKNAEFVHMVCEQNIRKDSPVLAELERDGEIRLVGASTGKVTILD